MQTFNIQPGMSNSTVKPTMITVGESWYVRFPGEYDVVHVVILDIPADGLVTVRLHSQRHYHESTVRTYFADECQWVAKTSVEGKSTRL